MKLIIVTAMTMLLAAAGAAQCKRTLEQAPEIRGLRLGMSYEEAEKVLGAEWKVSTFDPTYITMYRHTQDVYGFEGTRSIHLNAFDQKVIEISVQYTVRWGSSDEFAVNFTPKLGLDVKDLVSDRSYVTMDCGAFTVKFDALVGDSMLTLKDTAGVAARAKAIRDEEERKKRAIKP